MLTYGSLRERNPTASWQEHEVHGMCKNNNNKFRRVIKKVLTKGAFQIYYLRHFSVQDFIVTQQEILFQNLQRWGQVSAFPITLSMSTP